MTFTRANPFGWFKTDTLTSDQANQMDDNISHAIDTRDGYSNDVESEILVTNYGSMTFESGATILIEDPTNMFIGPGTMLLDCEVIGYSNPLRFGWIEEAVTSTSHTVSATAYKRYIIRLTGALTGTTNVILPTLSGYSKFIDNQCTGSYSLTVKTAAGTGVVIPNGKTAFVYCDGTNIVAGPIEPSNGTSSIYHMNETSAYGTTYQTITASSPVFLGGDYEEVFYNTEVGDMFEISYTAGLASSNALGTIYLQATASDAPFTMYETITAVEGTTEVVNTVSTVWTTAVGGTIAISLAAHVASYNGYVKTPLSFTVKHIKP